SPFAICGLPPESRTGFAPAVFLALTAGLRAPPARDPRLAFGFAVAFFSTRFMLVRSAFGFGLVERHGGANERLQGLRVDLLAFGNVDGRPCVPLKTGIEQA